MSNKIPSVPAALLVPTAERTALATIIELMEVGTNETRLRAAELFLCHADQINKPESDITVHDPDNGFWQSCNAGMDKLKAAGFTRRDVRNAGHTAEEATQLIAALGAGKLTVADVVKQAAEQSLSFGLKNVEVK